MEHWTDIKKIRFTGTGNASGQMVKSFSLYVKNSNWIISITVFLCHKKH